MRPQRFGSIVRSLIAGRAGHGLAFSVVALALGSMAAGPAQPSTANSQHVRGDNYYSAGQHVEITAPMPGDVVVAGRQIDIAQSVAGDLLAAGWRVTLSAPADDDVRIAAGEVTVNAPVTGDLTAAGGDVTLGPQTHVGGRSWITGRTVRIAGILDRELQVAGATVEISGEVRQPMRVIADQLDIRPSARILGAADLQGFDGTAHCRGRDRQWSDHLRTNTAARGPGGARLAGAVQSAVLGARVPDRASPRDLPAAG